MLSTKSVLPNFFKVVVITSMTISGMSSFAGEQEEGKKEIVDLKDMSSSINEQIKAVDMTEKADSSLIEGKMSDEAKEMMDSKADKMFDKTMESKPN